jgi:signal transduction histidine kinase
LPNLPVSAEVRHNLFLAFKEALNNVVKYAAATEVQIALIPGDSSFELRVTDNGRGFSASGINPSPPGQPVPETTSGHGLGNMRRRLEEIGGRCELQSEPGRGTRLSFHVHLKSSHEPS